MEYKLKNNIRNKILTLPAKISNGAKRHQVDIILVFGVILISLLSFAVGYITARTYDKPPLQFENIEPETLNYKQVPNSNYKHI